MIFYIQGKPATFSQCCNISCVYTTFKKIFTVIMLEHFRLNLFVCMPITLLKKHYNGLNQRLNCSIKKNGVHNLFNLWISVKEVMMLIKMHPTTLFWVMIIISMYEISAFIRIYISLHFSNCIDIYAILSNHKFITDV